MTSPSQELLSFAEDPASYITIGPDEERVLTDRYCVRFRPGDHYWSTTVQRLRFDDVDAGVEEIRALIRARGRNASAWTMGPSARPSGLVELLLALGMESESDEGSSILILVEPPRVPPTSLDVRLVSTYEEHLAAIEIAIEAFELPDSDAQDDLRRARAGFESERSSGRGFRMLAFDGDRPVGTGEGRFTPYGVHLGGGATIPSDRRRGAMSALIGTAWNEAVRRGTPALATFGGRMSAPALEQVGFRSVGRVRHLIDRMAETH